MSRSATRWGAVALLFASGVAASMQFAKVPPALDLVSSDFMLGPVAQGFAVSIVGAVGVVLGVVAGSLGAALGARRGLVLALGSGALFSLLAALAPDGTLFIAARGLEGLSHLGVVVTAPALMSAAASERDRPLAMAIWGCFFGVGYAVTAAVAPSILAAAGWRGLFIAHAGLLAALAAAVAMAVERDGPTAPFPRLADGLALHVRVYGNPRRGLLALVFGTYTLLFLALVGILGELLRTAGGLTPAMAGSLVAALLIVNLVATLAVGPLLRRGIDPVTLFLAGFASVALSAMPLVAGLANGVVLHALGAILMIALGVLPGVAFALLPRLSSGPGEIVLAAGAIAQCGNIGTFSGPPLAAALLAWLGIGGGALFIVGPCMAGAIFALALRRAMLNQNGMASRP